MSHEELLVRSEIITLHLPKTKQTLGLYSREVLAKMRPELPLINTCRGGIVDEDALLERLGVGRIAGGLFDVFAIEPAQNDRLLHHPNMLATPHIGASTEETRLIRRAPRSPGCTMPRWWSRGISTGCSGVSDTSRRVC